MNIFELKHLIKAIFHQEDSNLINQQNQIIKTELINGSV